ncbi:hypothetical protein I5Q82_03075 [Acutalibacter muris]|uniref:Uncharacterized protein n=1 Tax=Acutalibacter muris TaxID=1796620 RepID=A0AA92L6Z9_9FIRM|nr:hypothetical protein [Acutalibacter muris]QQR30701.1 hypothetical protein I5Q82_03075 [Acutalibacter muris]
MNQQNNVKFYLMQKALEYLVEKDVITQKESDRASRYNAEILRPDREYIR